MTGERLKQTIALWLIPGSGKRTAYLKKHHVFASMGENCSIMDRKVPLYANLIRIGNNVHLASNVSLVTHDITHVVLNQMWGGVERRIQEHVDCIEIGDNVFVGCNTTILGGVRIGSNVIIGAGSVVNKDIPDGSVAAGVPAKVIGSFDSFVSKRKNETEYPNDLKPHIGREVPKELGDWLWAEFDRKRH